MPTLRGPGVLESLDIHLPPLYPNHAPEVGTLGMGGAMMDSENYPVVYGLVQELTREDKALVEADMALYNAQIRFEVASQKYAAVRDVVARHLGRNPHSKGVESEYDVKFPSNGRYRFIHMSVGDAILDALKESEEPMTLEQIAEVLWNGHLRPVAPRIVNAALMRTTGVKRTEDGRYRYIPDPDDLPFE